MRTRTRGATALLAVAAMGLAGCGGNDASVAEDGEATVTVGAVDYAFEGVPASAAAGTTFRLDDRSDAEAHELLAVRLPDGEDRAVADLLALPPEELGPLVDEGLRGFALDFPEGYDGDVPAPAEVTIDEPGRYVFLCLLPQNAPPAEIAASIAEYLARNGEGGPPAHPETGPPHAVAGMATEVTIS